MTARLRIAGTGCLVLLLFVAAPILALSGAPVVLVAAPFVVAAALAVGAIAHAAFRPMRFVTSLAVVVGAAHEHDLRDALEDPGLAHEPRLALTPGADALRCLREIARDAPRHLEPGGWLLLEHGTTQAAAVRDELVLAGCRYVRSHRDLAGHERITEGQYDPL